jgi:predicted DNA-binding transcriptional regulator AlpA
MAPEDTSSLVGFRELHRRYSAGRSERAFRVWVWRNVRAGLFPPPLAISPHSRAWAPRSLAEWEASLRPVNYAPPKPTPEAA